MCDNRTESDALLSGVIGLERSYVRCSPVCAVMEGHLALARFSPVMSVYRQTHEYTNMRHGQRDTRPIRARLHGLACPTNQKGLHAAHCRAEARVRRQDCRRTPAKGLRAIPRCEAREDPARSPACSSLGGILGSRLELVSDRAQCPTGCEAAALAASRPACLRRGVRGSDCDSPTAHEARHEAGASDRAAPGRHPTVQVVRHSRWSAAPSAVEDGQTPGDRTQQGIETSSRSMLVATARRLQRMRIHPADAQREALYKRRIPGDVPACYAEMDGAGRLQVSLSRPTCARGDEMRHARDRHAASRAFQYFYDAQGLP